MVRDGFAAFFWHPYLVTKPGVGVAHLHELVQQIRGLGYTFVGVARCRAERRPYVGEIEPA